MSAPNSEHVSESGRRDSAYSPQGMQGPLFARLGSQKIQSRIQDWSNDQKTPGPGFAVQAYSCPGFPASIPRSLPAVQSSMVLTTKSMASRNSSPTSSVPSLSSGPSSQSESTLCSSDTGIAVRPGPFDGDGYCISNAGSDSETNDSCRPVKMKPRGVPCLFRFLNCPQTFTDVDHWNEHCKSHFKGRAPPRNLRCPYSSCAWTASRQDGEEAWDQRWEHFAQEHDVLSHDEELSEEPDAPLVQYLWSVRAISDVQLQELKQSGRIGSDCTPYVVTEKTERHRRRQAASRR